MLRAFIIVVLAGAVLIGAGYVYGRVKRADVFQEIHARQAEQRKKERDPGGFLMWIGGGLVMIGGAGAGHVLLKAPDDEPTSDEQGK